MKTIKVYFIAVLAVLFSVSSYAQMHDHNAMVASKTETFKVSGNCGMCKSRIEKAAHVNGVSKADWNEETKVLTLTYNPDKVTSTEVMKKIAAVGHDTEKIKSEEAVYNKLPGCCKYR